MKTLLAGTAFLAAAGCSCAPVAENSSPDALWGEWLSAFRALADARNAAAEVQSSPFMQVSNTDAREARSKALREEVSRAESRLDQAECALDRARR